MKVRYPVTLRRLGLFKVTRAKEESILSFINRVKEDARYADVEALSKDKIITMIIVGRCNVPKLTERWSMEKSLTLVSYLFRRMKSQVRSSSYLAALLASPKHKGLT